MPRKLWSEVEDQNLYSMLKKGMKIKDIAEVLDRTPDSVTKRKIRKGWTEFMDESLPAKFRNQWTEDEDDRLMNLVNQGMTQNEISDVLGRSRKAVAYRYAVLIGKEGRLPEVTPNELKLIKEMTEQGKSKRAISKTIGRSVPTVHAYVNKHGFKKKAMPEPELIPELEPEPELIPKPNRNLARMWLRAMITVAKRNESGHL